MIWIRVKAFFANAWTSYKVYILIGAAILGLLIWMKGATTWNHVSGWFYSRGTDRTHEQIDQTKAEAEPYKQVAQDALNKLAEEKKVSAEERRKRELAEQILADKSKTTNQKLKAYEDAVNRAPTVSPPASTDELCTRAESLGLSCD